MKTIAKIFAVLAILGLIISSFAFVPFAGAQVTAAPVLDRDLAIGARGPQVQGVQLLLISFGYAIPAGATGYFGEQTRSALASYQRDRGIVPAVGYFGPKTRSAFAATSPAPIPAPTDNNDAGTDADEDEREDAEEAIAMAADALDDARDEIEEADEDGDDLNDSEDYLDAAEEALEDAEEAYDDRNYDDAIKLAGVAEERAERAVADVEEGGSENNGRISTSARESRVNGPDNDVAAFEIELPVSAFGDDAYISDEASVSVEYRIEDEAGATVGGGGRSVSISSRGDEDGGYYRIDEDGEERFRIGVVFDPQPMDEGRQFRLQLLGIRYNDEPAPPDVTWNARPEGRYDTDYMYVAD